MRPSPPDYHALAGDPLQQDMSIGHMDCSEVISLVLENQQFKLKLKLLSADASITADRLAEYMLLLKDTKAALFLAEVKYQELERARNSERVKLFMEMKVLRESCEEYESQNGELRKEFKSEQLKNLKLSEEPEKTRTESLHGQENTSIEFEFKPIYRSPEDMMKTRFDILAQLPVPKEIAAETLKPIGIPDRFTLHEFLLGSASGSLRNALSGYCAFTENTTMWCPQREEHGFYLTPLYKCDTGPRSNVIHRWVKVDIKARMSKPTECFYKKDGEWYYTGTYKSLRLEDLTPKEYDNLSEATRDALVKETLAGRKNATPQVFFETAQLYAAGALKVAVVGIQCVGFNRMLYSVALQQAQRFQINGKGKTTATTKAVVA